MMNQLSMFRSPKLSNNNMLNSSPIRIHVIVVVICRRVSPIVQIVRTVRPTMPVLASEIGRFHKGVLKKETTIFGKEHESIIDSDLRTDKKASHSNTVLTSKPYAHKVDPTVSETDILSETTLAKGGKGKQFYTWKDFGRRRVNQYQIKNNFTSRRPTTPEEDKNFQAAKRLQNAPVYRHPAVTQEKRYSGPATTINTPKTLTEIAAEKFNLHNNKAQKKPEEKASENSYDSESENGTNTKHYKND